MKKLIVGITLTLTFASAIAQNTLKVGAIAPPILFDKSYQKNYKVPKNKLLILDFWATWCGPCVAGLLESNTFIDKYNDKFEYIGITDPTSVNSEQFIKTQKLQHKFIYDDGRIFKDYGVTGIPHAYIIDKQGVIIWSGNGRDITEELLNRYLSTGSFEKNKTPIIQVKKTVTKPIILKELPTLGNYELIISEDKNPEITYSFSRSFKSEKFVYLAQLQPIKSIIASLYSDQSSRIIDRSNKNIESKKISVKLTASNVDPEKTISNILESIANRYEFKISLKNIDTAVYFVSVKNPKLLKTTMMVSKKGVNGQGPKYQNSIQNDHYLTALNSTIAELAQNIERQFNVFCKFEGNDNIGYDFLSIDTPDFDTFKTLLASKYGVELTKKIVPLEFMVIE